MTNPYSGLPPSAFWRSGVSDVSALEFADIYRPRFEVGRDMAIAAAGSCFAQHIGRQFKERGYRFLDVEPAPGPLAPEKRPAYGFDMFSGRYGNVYSVRQLVQMFDRAAGRFQPEETVWETDGRFYDPFRPGIQPGGFASRAEAEADTAWHLAQVDRLLDEAELFVFTFGLTEGWVNLSDGAALPTCPGTVAGRFDPEKYAFHNYTFSEVMADAERFIAMARARNPDMRFLFTVSPVPLTATASGDHVLPATVYSKSVLRAVCGELTQKYDHVDYFPSFELVASHPMRAMYFQPNLRSVSPVGVGRVMNVFFGAHDRADATEGATAQAAPTAQAPQAAQQTPSGPAAPRPAEDDLICEEAILAEFGNADTGARPDR